MRVQGNLMKLESCWVSLAVLVLTVTLGCNREASESAKIEAATSPTPPIVRETGDGMTIHLSVSMPVASGGFPNAEELAARNRIEDELTERGLGQCTGAGGGLGEMDISFQVKDEASARAMIAEVVAKHLPKIPVRVTRIPD